MTMNEPPSQATIARALDIAKSRVTALKKIGMPVDSIEGARAWRDANLNPARTKDFMRLAMAPRAQSSTERAPMLQQAIALAENAADALEAGVFWAAVPGLQFAMKCLSSKQREQFTMPMTVWSELTREMVASLTANAAVIDKPLDHFLKPDETVSEYMENFWFEVAAGIVVRNDHDSLSLVA